jgi:hypothetical protein
MMKIMERLPDDLVLRIYTKYLKRYRFFDGQLIKLIDIDKYSFLQNHIGHRISKFINLSTISESANQRKYSITYAIPNLYQLSNRSDLYIDNDMICMEIVEEENSIHFEVLRFRLKPIEFFNKEYKPSIYHRGKLKDYDWEVLSYSYSM